MNPYSMKHRLAVTTLAALATMTTFAVFVLAPIAAAGGMA